MKELNFDHEIKTKTRIGGAGSMRNPTYNSKIDHDWRNNGATKARTEVQKAIRKGILLCLKKNKVKCCLCRYRATEYDHRDYNKPLEVSPVCKSCNQEIGKAIPLEKHYGRINQ